MNTEIKENLPVCLLYQHGPLRRPATVMADRQQEVTITTAARYNMEPAAAITVK